MVTDWIAAREGSRPRGCRVHARHNKRGETPMNRYRSRLAHDMAGWDQASRRLPFGFQG